MSGNNFAEIKNKHRKGLTLVELIIAVTMLGIAIAGVVTVFHVGLSTSARANYLTGASIEAQLQMESLMGRFWCADLATEDWGIRLPCSSGDFDVRLEREFYAASIVEFCTDATCCAGYEDGIDEGYLMLIRVTVYVYRPSDSDWFFRHSNIINVSGSIV
ncbi:MAG: type II secretion system GspH family protein [Defluviitaleaceae bacterium]|nr:type II secretion system GspH family protein [Defluviitaleaceae bacterium]MCL2262155.1 type II secretion system GspH family protein [Defluviitaleaceae bacterium]